MARQKSDKGPGSSTGMTDERRQALRRLAEMVLAGKHTQREMQAACRIAPKTIQEARALAGAQEGITAEQLGAQLWALRQANFDRMYEKRSAVKDAKRIARQRQEAAELSARLAGIPRIGGWQLPQHSPPKHPAGCSESRHDGGIPSHRLAL